MPLPMQVAERASQRGLGWDQATMLLEPSLELVENRTTLLSSVENGKAGGIGCQMSGAASLSFDELGDRHQQIDRRIHPAAQVGRLRGPAPSGYRRPCDHRR